MPIHRRKPSHSRHGFSLLELTAAVLVIGILAAAAVGRFGTSGSANFAAQADARRLAAEMLQAKRRALATGDNHLLQFQSQGGRLISYTLYRRYPDNSTAAVDAARTFDAALNVTSATGTTAEFTFEGAALAAYQFTLVGPNRTWQIDVTPATAAVRVTHTP